MAERATRAPREKAALERLDKLTPYYRRRMSSLPRQQRHMACALARADRPMGSTETTRAIGLEPRAAATALTRLRAKGIVLHPGRSWTLADPWLGAWYKMRTETSQTCRTRPSRRNRPPVTSRCWRRESQSPTGDEGTENGENEKSGRKQEKAPQAQRGGEPWMKTNRQQDGSGKPSP